MNDELEQAFREGLVQGNKQAKELRGLLAASLFYLGEAHFNNKRLYPDVEKLQKDIRSQLDKE